MREGGQFSCRKGVRSGCRLTSLGYVISDVAKVYTGEYLNIAYDRNGEEGGDQAGSQYYSNFFTDKPGYGNSMTGYFNNGAWVPSTIRTASLDCVGYVNLVSYAAGALKDGQAYNLLSNKRRPDDSSKEYASAYQAAQLGAIARGVPDSLPGRIDYSFLDSEADRQKAGIDPNGVYRTYFDSRVNPVAAPQVGDLVFMGSGNDVHIGFYGVDDQGQNILIHSAPSTVIGRDTYEAGPRTNTLIDWNSTRANDSYSNSLVANGYFTGWTDQFNSRGTNFGRIKPWWDTSLLGGR